MTAQVPVRRHRSFGAGVTAVILGAAVLLVGPSAGPAHACSCMVSSDEEQFARAEAVFRGQLVGYQPPPAQPFMSSGDPAIWTFAVSEVYKGDVAPSQPVISAVSGASCGLEIPHQGEFFVFASRRDIMGQATPGPYHASLCGGTRATSAGPLAVAALRPTTTVTTATLPPTTQAPATEAPTTEAPPVTTVAPVPVAEPAPTTTVAVPASLERQGLSGEPEAALAASEDGGGGLPTGLVVVAAAAALLGLGGVGVYRRRAGAR